MNKLTLIGILFIVACSASRLATPKQTDIDRVAEKYPDYSLAQLNEGKALYQANCGKCHRLEKPIHYSEEKWNKIVPKMVIKANNKGSTIDEKGQELILKYVVTMSGR